MMMRNVVEELATRGHEVCFPEILTKHNNLNIKFPRYERNLGTFILNTNK